MTVTLYLTPEVEAGLLAQAREKGVGLEDYVQSVVEDAVLPAVERTLSAEKRADAFEAWSLGHRDTPPLSDYAVSREGIFDGRDL